MANGIYEGGLVEGNPSLHPSSSSDEGDQSPSAGVGGGYIRYTKGGAPGMNNSYGAQSGDVNFVDDASYKGDMSVECNPSMKVRNPDDLSNSPTGK